MNKTVAAVLAATMLGMSAVADVVISAPVEVNTSPSRNGWWSTLFTNEVPLTWDWVTNATSAHLEIKGMNGSIATNFQSVATNWLWQVFAPGAPPMEDVYDLTLTFNTGVVLTSRLAVVAGAFGAAVVDPGPESKTWGRVADSAVIPYDADWTNATAGAASSQLVISRDELSQTYALEDAGGYFGWKVRGAGWGTGVFSLSLTFPEAETGGWSALLTRVPSGTFLGLR